MAYKFIGEAKIIEDPIGEPYSYLCITAEGRGDVCLAKKIKAESTKLVELRDALNEWKRGDKLKKLKGDK